MSRRSSTPFRALHPVALCAGAAFFTACVGAEPAVPNDGSADGNPTEDAPAVGNQSDTGGSPGTDAFAGSDAVSDARTPIGDAGGADVEGETGSASDASPPPMCTSSQLLCGGTCVPNDTHNCGTCGNDCTKLPNVVGAVSCTQGACSVPQSSCAAGYAHCTGGVAEGCETKIDTSSNCGGCGTACPSTAPMCAGSGSTYACSSGCPAATPVLCATSCVNTSTDAQNCASCGHGCTTAVANATATCSASACGYTCNASYPNACAGGCVDFQSDANACGGCGSAYACSGGETCQSGHCACPTGTHLCGATCESNTSTSSCGTSCTACPVPADGSATCNGTACGTQCPSGDMLCGSTCANVSNDPKNCGTCGKSCLSGSCSGTCQPWLVYQPSGGVAGIACDGTNLVWLDDSSNAVLQVSVAGGSATQLASLPSGYSPQFIALGGGVVAYTALSPGNAAANPAQYSLVYLYNAYESTPSTAQIPALGTFGDGMGPTVERGLAISATGGTSYFEYFDDFDGQGGIESCASNGICTPLGPNGGGDLPDDLVLGNGFIFWTENGSGAVMGYNLGAGSSETVATGLTGPYVLTTDSTYVYWGNQAEAASTFSIYRTSQANPNPTPTPVLSATTVSTNVGNPNFIAADGTNVYFTGGAAEIEYVAAGGGSAQTLYTGSAKASFLVYAGGALYYVDSGTGGIYGLAVP